MKKQLENSYLRDEFEEKMKEEKDGSVNVCYEGEEGGEVVYIVVADLRSVMCEKGGSEESLIRKLFEENK